MAKAKKSSKTAERTLVTFLLDRSGSMESVKAGTIEAFNGYLDGLLGDGDLIDFTLVQFDTNSIEKVCVAVPVASAPALDNTNYQPRGGTPLIDAAYKTIKAVEASLAEQKRKIVICIQTDGEENASREYTWAQLADLIKEKTAAGWQFNFLGAGIDAYDQGSKMGISAMATMSYDAHNPATNRAAFRASASNTAGFAAGARLDTTYTMAQRSASGDKFSHRAQGRPLDLTAPLAKPAPARAEKKIVEDFTL